MIFTVAIDGPAAAGKGTISKHVAAELGFAHLDTGLLYRATGARVLRGEAPLDAAKDLTPEDLQQGGLRTPEVAQAASKIAALPEIREALTKFQRDFAKREGGAVLDGRDIGTVICPDADVKLFVTASDSVRAERRYQELLAKGLDVTLDGVLSDLRIRDQRDRERQAAPLKPATDAILIDTSQMGIEDATTAALTHIRSRLPR